MGGRIRNKKGGGSHFCLKVRGRAGRVLVDSPSGTGEERSGKAQGDPTRTREGREGKAKGSIQLKKPMGLNEGLSEARGKGWKIPINGGKGGDW